jgi:ribosome-binding factor A
VKEITHTRVTAAEITPDDKIETVFVTIGTTREDEDNALDAALRHYWKRKKEYCLFHNIPWEHLPSGD